jgi:D-inositol-3-phosphate glycosyltransferase
LPEIEDGQNACLVEPENPAETASAVREIAESPALRTRLEEGALALSATFAWDRIAESTAAFFDRLLKEG